MKRHRTHVTLGLAVLLVLVMPAQALAAYYTVQPGDTLWEIARWFGTDVYTLESWNPGAGWWIYPGQTLAVPDRPQASRGVFWGAVPYSRDDLLLLARLIEAEAGGEPYLGKVAVGAVVVNRARSGFFPSSIRGVIFDPGQFEPVLNGYIWDVYPSEESLRAAQEALAGYDPTGGAVYFYAYNKVWDPYMSSRPWAATIGGHRFTY
ncbi:MAG: cell wall hydrolase [Bacillota bacterium]|nr:cell wall hydrolase [Bacillota bacterium]